MLLAVGVSIYASALFVGLVELFPTALCCRGHGISYNISVAVFGGTTPLIATALIGTIWLADILLVPETRNIDLRSSIYGSPPSVSAR